MRTLKEFNNIKIVEYSDEIAEAVAKFQTISGEDWGGSQAVKTTEQVIAEHAVSSNLHTFIAMSEDEAVGYCTLTTFYKDIDTLYIGFLDVIPAYQSRKIGKELVLLCVDKTIELGYKRLDIHTWKGNTKAVPLYKKCGFLLQDRGDTALLNNYIPEIITNPYFSDYFANVHWYDDYQNDASILAPDEIKANKFGFYNYNWEKDGQKLTLGYEKYGKMIHLIETNEYKIEMHATNHELAFGMNYECSFTIHNKTDNDLEITITGNANEYIELDLNHQSKINDKVVVEGQFLVKELGYKQDKFKPHPVVSASVTINNKTVAMGLGIDIKAPIKAKMINPKWQLSQIGTCETRYINFENGINEDITVRFEFENKNYVTEIRANAKASIKLEYQPTWLGHRKVETEYQVKTTTDTINFKQPLDVINYGFGEPFSFETDEIYGLRNGMWQLDYHKEGNSAVLSHAFMRFDIPYHCVRFMPVILGKPFVEEFEAMIPVVKMYQENHEMILEIKNDSQKFRGISCTRVIKFDATGRTTSHLFIENTTETDEHVFVVDNILHPLEPDTTFMFDGNVTTKNWGTEDFDVNKFEENWLFTNSFGNLTFGFCWPTNYKFNSRWGEDFSFEVDCGIIKAGSTCVTQPVESHCGIFSDFQSFRAYAKKLSVEELAGITESLEMVVNHYNPFTQADVVSVEIKNQRSIALEGEIRVATATSKTVRTDENENSFNVKIGNNIEKVTTTFDLVSEKSEMSKTVFKTTGEVTETQVEDSFIINNNAIEFKVDGNYSPGVYSLKTVDNNKEWLRNQYPNHAPYAWANPFLGGIFTIIGDMDTNMIINEKITTEFATKVDNFGNEWKGIVTTAYINKYEESEGAIYKSYFLTLPGVPVLCQYAEYYNGTGMMKTEEIGTYVHFDIDENLKNVLVDVTSKQKEKSTLRAGSVYSEKLFDGVAKFYNTEEKSAYVVGNMQGLNHFNDVVIDNKISCSTSNYEINVAANETFTTRPEFVIVSEVELDAEMLADFKRIKF